MARRRPTARGRLGTIGVMSEPLHLVDTTMFWSPTGGGVRRYLQTKHEWLAGQPRWRHTLAVPRIAGAAAGGATLPSMPLPFSGGYRLPIRRAAMAGVLESLAPDVIEAGDPYRVAWAARDAAQALGVPAVAYCHSNIVALARLAAGRRFAGAAARLAERYARRVYGGFDLVLAPSRSMAGHLAAWGVARVAWQPLGVDSTLFAPARRDPAWRQRHGYSPATRLLVYAGRFAPEKHLDVLVDAVRRLGAPYEFLAIGAGPTPPPAGDRVTVLPFVASTSELATALASADAFVHAGDQETFGLSVLEAMACGTPAVVRDAEGLGELVDRDSGSAVDTGTGAAFAAAIAALFEGDAMAAHAQAARRRAVAGDWQRVLPSLLGHYLRLIGEPAAPPVVVVRDDPAAACPR
jgi:alpha-1,6-mannosyltransferase